MRGNTAQFSPKYLWGNLTCDILWTKKGQNAAQFGPTCFSSNSTPLVFLIKKNRQNAAHFSKRLLKDILLLKTLVHAREKCCPISRIKVFANSLLIIFRSGNKTGKMLLSAHMFSKNFLQGSYSIVHSFVHGVTAGEFGEMLPNITDRRHTRNSMLQCSEYQAVRILSVLNKTFENWLFQASVQKREKCCPFLSRNFSKKSKGLENFKSLEMFSKLREMLPNFVQDILKKFQVVNFRAQLWTTEQENIGPWLSKNPLTCHHIQSFIA